MSKNIFAVQPGSGTPRCTERNHRGIAPWRSRNVRRRIATLGTGIGEGHNRRIQAIHDWRENYENGAHYFELRDYLSESQRTELDDSLRLTLTARQLQFNSKNVANVFDDLSIAGGRFATLIEFARRNKARQATDPPGQPGEAVPEAERAIDHDNQPVRNSSPEFEPVPETHDPFVNGQEAEQRSASAAEFPALCIKDVFPKQDQAPLVERLAHAASQQFEIEASEFEDADSSSPTEHPHQEGRHPPAFSGLATPVRTGQSSAGRIEGWPSRFSALELSASQLALCALRFLFATLAFTVGLTAGRGSLPKHLAEAPKSMLAGDVKSPILPDQADESTSRAVTPPVASSDESARIKKLDDHPAFAEKSKESARDSESLQRSPTPYRLAVTIGAAPHLPGPSTILVTVPSRGRPFRVSSPKKAIAATSSFAMTSQLSILVSAQSGPAVAHNPARLEGGGLASFVWPRYARPGTIRVRATIGELGQVLEVEFLSGSVSLLPATRQAIRQWRYTPALLDARPVQAQQDVTIEFRPPHYSSQASTRRSSRSFRN